MTDEIALLAGFGDPLREERRGDTRCLTGGEAGPHDPDGGKGFVSGGEAAAREEYPGDFPAGE